MPFAHAVASCNDLAQWDDEESLKGKSMKVIIDLTVCEGHGRCYENAFELFDEGPDGKSVAKMSEVYDDDFDMQRVARSASMMCPVNAITIVEDE